MGAMLGAISAAGGGPPSAHNYDIQGQSFLNPVGDQSGNWNAGMSNMLGQTAGNSPTTQGVQLNTNQFNNAYGQEQGLADRYNQMAEGKGPSLATITANQQSQQGLNNTLAALGSQSGSTDPALAQRAVLNAGANAQSQAAANAVQGRTQEELGAMGAMGNIYNAQAGQAAGVANQNAQLTQNNQLANLNAALQNKQINAQQYNQYMNLLQAQNLAQFQSSQNEQKLGLQNSLGQSAINVPAQEWYGQQMGQGYNSILSGMGGMASMSDKKSKKNITKAETELDIFLTHINKIMKERK